VRQRCRPRRCARAIGLRRSQSPSRIKFCAHRTMTSSTMLRSIFSARDFACRAPVRWVWLRLIAREQKAQGFFGVSRRPEAFRRGASWKRLRKCRPVWGIANFLERDQARALRCVNRSSPAETNSDFRRSTERCRRLFPKRRGRAGGANQNRRSREDWFRAAFDQGVSQFKSKAGGAELAEIAIDECRLSTASVFVSCGLTSAVADVPGRKHGDGPAR